MFHPDFERFVNEDVLPLSDLDSACFWQGLQTLVDEFTPSTSALLTRRLDIQAQIDSWHAANPEHSETDYFSFLQSIGYLLPEGEDFQIDTANVDAEIASLAGPQLVVPLKNARFALNAANARWGSLYDALYGSDIIIDDPMKSRMPGYDPERGAKVIAYAHRFLDSTAPLQDGSHADVAAYFVDEGLRVKLRSGVLTQLQDESQFAGYRGLPDGLSALFLKNHGLHIELVIDRAGAIGSDDLAGVNDVRLEAALTTIMDCEDSVAAVDAEDKIDVYRNWLGLMTGSLRAKFTKSGVEMTRALNSDVEFFSPSGEPCSLPGRSTLFNRNVGHLMQTELAQDSLGANAPEHVIDAVMTALISSIDLNSNHGYNNTRHGSIYIVKPKMHGPEEVAFTCELFSRVEALLSLPVNTLKLGIMDEERRTSANLKECIRAAKSRLVFINTGFLDLGNRC